MIPVLFIAYYFPPIGGSGVQRTLKFVQYLPAEGFPPAVITGPNVRGTRGDRWSPRDHSLSGLIPPEVSVHRILTDPPAPRSGLHRRVERWLAFPSASETWWIRTVTDLGSLVGGGAKVIFATMSPYESGEAARRLSQRLGIPWVADLRDPWALDDIQIYPSWFHRQIDLKRMERVLSTASLIIMNTHAATAALKKKIPSLDNKPIITITNGFDGSDFAKTVISRTDAKFRIVHSGGMFTDSGLQLRRRNFYRLLGGVEPGVDILTRSPKFLLEAVGRWRERCPEMQQSTDIVFAGDATERDREVVQSSRIPELVRFAGYLSHEESLSLIRTADLLFLPMHNLPAGTACRSIPGKTFEYMASGRPILAAVPDGDARDFLRQSGNALLCRPDDVEGMVEILDRVYLAWKEGRSVVRFNSEYVSQFDRRNQTRALAECFRQVLGCAGSADLLPKRMSTEVIPSEFQKTSPVENGVSTSL